MPLNLHRISRTRPPREPVSIEQLRGARQALEAAHGRVHLTDHQLDDLSVVTDPDIDAAVKLWDDAQHAAGTGLVGLLDGA